MGKQPPKLGCFDSIEYNSKNTIYILCTYVQYNTDTIPRTHDHMISISYKHYCNLGYKVDSRHERDLV